MLLPDALEEFEAGTATASALQRIPYPAITAGEAVEIATTAIRELGPSDSAWLEGTHGSTIAFAELRAIAAPVLAHTPYEVPAGLDAPFRNSAGPYWVLTFGDRAGRPVVGMAVAALTEYRLVDGRLHNPSTIAGNDFRWWGLRRGSGTFSPPRLEEVVGLVSRATGARVARAPVLIKPGDRTAASGSHWRIVIDRPVVASVQGMQRSVTEIFVGWDLSMYVAAPDQPPGTEIVSSSVSGREAPVEVTRTYAPRRDDMPVAFDRVTLPGGLR